MMTSAYIKAISAAALRGAAAKEYGQLGNLAGSILQKGIEAAQHPDTRSWMTLPNQILSARVIVPENQKTVTITTYGPRGRLASKVIKLQGTDSTVVYATSYGKNLTAIERIMPKKNESN